MPSSLVGVKGLTGTADVNLETIYAYYTHKLQRGSLKIN